MNDIAKSVIQKQMGSHLEFVFVYRGHPVSRMNDSAFRNARARLAEKLPNIKNISILIYGLSGSKILGFKYSNIYDDLGWGIVIL